jgi:hypothetical protein
MFLIFRKTIKTIKTMMLGVALLFLSLTAMKSAQAQVSITGTRTGAFTYSFSVFNGTLTDLATFSLDIPANMVLTTLTAPSGFLTAYEQALGRVDFLADTSAFTAGATTTGFSFQSIVLFSPSTYTVLNNNGIEYQQPSSGVVFPGATTLVAAPEPATLTLLALMGIPGAILARRNKK